MRAVVLFVVGLAAACRTSGSTQVSTMHPPVELPVVVENDRFFLVTRTASGVPLRMFLDSAGGMFMTRQAAERLRLPVKRVTTGEGEHDSVAFPAFYDGRVPRPRLEAFPVLDGGPLRGADGMFGAPWFAGRVFTFDYAARKLWLRSAGDVPAVDAQHRIAFALPRDHAGQPMTPYGRVQISVDGAPIDMLFDTGATAVLSEAARRQLGGAGELATSFIIETVYARWRTAHPDWRVIEDAEQGAGAPMPMIEVPRVTIAGHDVGPVWFARRPDRNLHDLARIMDRPSDGALGGSALRYFQRVTVDWVNGTAVFEK